MKHRSETLGHGIFYTARLSLIRDRTDKISESVESEGSDTEMRDSEDDVGQKMSRTVKSEAVNL
jgi:hypothetical protein